MTLPRLHVVTDDAVVMGTTFLTDALEILTEGGNQVALHLRAHRVPVRILWSAAEQLVTAASAAGSFLLVNDRIDIALGARAHGVQLGRRSLPIGAARRLVGEHWIGYSAHDVNEAVWAEEKGTDFVLLGTIHPSPTHPELTAAGSALLREAATRLQIPTIAIGGMTVERLPQVLAAGAHGIAAISGIWHTPEPVRAAAAYRNAISTAVRS